MKSRQQLKRGLLVLVLITMSALIFAAFGRELVPSVLTIHRPLQGWHSIEVDGHVITDPRAQVQISPIVYGEHNLQVQLADGKIVWFAFYHSDIGVDRQVNIYMDYKPTTDKMTFCETLTRYETYPGITRTVFSGSVKPEYTSAAKPFILDWI